MRTLIRAGLNNSTQGLRPSWGGIGFLFLGALVMSGCVPGGSSQKPHIDQPSARSEDRSPRQPKEKFRTTGEALPQVPPKHKRTMHRNLAGEPDTDGWCLADSTEGGFSVQLPSLFNDFTLTTQSAEGVDIKLCIVGSKTESGMTYAATANLRSDRWVPKDLSNFGRNWDDVVERRSISQAGLQALALRVRNAGATMAMRVLLSDAAVYSLSAEYERGSDFPPHLAGDVQRFLDSFQLLPPKK